MQVNNDTTLCDVHCEFIRKNGIHDLEQWCFDSNNVYIGRKGILIINGKRFPQHDSFWANPFKVDKDGDLKTVLYKYYDYITNKINNDNSVVYELAKLKGKNLGCWCVGNNVVKNSPPETWICHGQILLFLIDYYTQQGLI